VFFFQTLTFSGQYNLTKSNNTRKSRRNNYTHFLHQRQKPGFLRLLQPESLDYSLINPFFQVLLRMVQDVSTRIDLLKNSKILFRLKLKRVCNYSQVWLLLRSETARRTVTVDPSRTPSTTDEVQKHKNRISANLYP
jgi:hypothetical protein